MVNHVIGIKRENGLYGTIRCNELNIPAAIGCGDAIFEKIKSANKINLNCKNLLIKEQ